MARYTNAASSKTQEGAHFDRIAPARRGEGSDCADSGSSGSSGPSGGLCTTEEGLVWEYINRAESDFLYHEIFCANLYLREGVTLFDGDIVVDVGANIGLFSLLCLSEGSSTRVIAIEPVPQICDVLRRNLYFAGDRAKVIRAAAGSRHADPAAPPVRLTYFPQRPGESTRHAAEAHDMMKTLRMCAADPASRAKYDFDGGVDDANGVAEAEGIAAGVEAEAPACTLLDVIRQESLPCIDLLKVDVEGDELDVLMGLGQEGLELVRQVVVEVHDVCGRVRRVTDLLEQGGFQSVVSRRVQTEVCEDGFVLFVPPELELYMVYATR